MMNKPFTGFRIVVAVFVMGVLVGCENPKKASVSGLVTLDGDPLTHGTVTFVAGSKTNARSAAGGIQPDGTFRVQIGRSGKLMTGEYVVKVEARGPSIPHPEGGPPELGELQTPPHYARIETSGLRYNIRSGENVVDIALVSDDPLTSATPETDTETALETTGSQETPSKNENQHIASSIEESTAEDSAIENADLGTAIEQSP